MAFRTTMLLAGGRDFPVLEVVDPAVRSRLVGVLHALTGDGRSAPTFPGPNPVSLERADLPKLGSTPYHVCEKTDGVRLCLVMADLEGFENVCFAADRKLGVFVLPMRAVPTAMFQGSVLDGELAWNRTSRQWEFVVFDAVILCGVPVFHRPFSHRVGLAQKALRVYERHDEDAVAVRVKDFVPLHDAAGVRDRLAQAARSFDVDGLILTPENAPVTFGRHMGMYKLKFYESPGKCPHTVDFLASSAGQLSVFDAETRTHVPVARLAGPPPPGAAGKVLECRHVGGDAWETVLVRTDKTTANDLFTFRKTCLNIRENLSLGDVLAAVVNT